MSETRPFDATPSEGGPTDGSPGAARPLRRPYQPPRILWREPLESVAAVCAPTPPAKGNPGICPQGPISS